MSDINLYITSDITSSERRVSPQWSISYLKQRLELITGIEPEYQIIHYYASPSSGEYRVISAAGLKVEDDTTYISALNLNSYSRLHIIDDNSNSKLKDIRQMEDSKDPSVEFKYSDEEYRKRNDSVLKWKENQRLGRFDPEFEKKKSSMIQENLKLSSVMEVGQRCRIINIQGERRGTIRFIGKILELDDGSETWVGVEFDEPVGRNNGAIGDTQIFQCRENHGSFVRPKVIEVGDFPEIDPFDSDEDEL